MNANTNIKQGYKQTSLGILPQEWEVVRLGDICEIYQPQTIPQSDFTKEGYNVYGANGIIGKYHSYNHEKEQIAIACRGNSCGAVNFTNPKSWITGNAMVINLDNSKNADKIFVYYVLLNSNLNYLVTGSGQPQITSNIKNHSIKLPTLAEQEKIAQILGVWDKGISVLKSLIEAKTKRKKALMQRLLTPPTHPLTPSAREGEQKSHHDTKAPPLAGGVGVGYSHIENNRNDDKVLDCHDLTASNLAMTEKTAKAKQSLRFAEFTDKWQEMRLGDILEYEQPTKYLVKNTEYSNLYQTPVLTAGKTFILGKTNENFGVYKDLPIILFDDFMTTSKFVDFPFKVKSSASKILKPKTNNINLKIVFEMMQTIDFCAKDHKRYWISEYQNLTIKLPTLAEQKKIAQVLSACDKEIELLKSKFQCLKMQKKGLMQRLLNGEVRVKC